MSGSTGPQTLSGWSGTCDSHPSSFRLRSETAYDGCSERRRTLQVGGCTLPQRRHSDSRGKHMHSAYLPRAWAPDSATISLSLKPMRPKISLRSCTVQVRYLAARGRHQKEPTLGACSPER